MPPPADVGAGRSGTRGTWLHFYHLASSVARPGAPAAQNPGVTAEGRAQEEGQVSFPDCKGEREHPAFVSSL